MKIKVAWLINLTGRICLPSYSKTEFSDEKPNTFLVEPFLCFAEGKTGKFFPVNQYALSPKTVHFLFEDLPEAGMVDTRSGAQAVIKGKTRRCVSKMHGRSICGNMVDD